MIHGVARQAPGCGAGAGPSGIAAAGPTGGGGWAGAGCNAMSDQDALGADMHPPPGFLAAAPPVGDPDMLERLLEGRLDPGSVPPGYGGLARLLAAAAAPAAPAELAGEQAALASFAAALGSRPPLLAPRRAAGPGKGLPLKAAAAALVAVLSLAGVAAGSGLLADRAAPVAAPAAAGTAAGAAHGLGGAAVADTGGMAPAGAAGGRGRAVAGGPEAAGAARAGLCRAWQAGRGGDHGARMDAVAFRALVAAAGGADRVAGWCQDVTGGASAGSHGQASPPSSGPPADAGPPADPGPPASTGPGGHRQGEPPR
jgi:hypothetical protein